MKGFIVALVSFWLSFGGAFAFAPSTLSSSSLSISLSKTTTALSMANDELRRFDKSARSASSDDTVVTLMRPLGLVLNQDESGNVYVETVAPKGNAARTGKVSKALVGME
jgi:hypothetical protein